MYQYINGNITREDVYSYTTADITEAPLYSNVYGYGDSSWNDLLTSYNGSSITYDAIGNMTSYNGRTYSWMGRQLQGFTSDDMNVSYKYNANGQRIQKIVAESTKTTTWDYYYNGSTLAGQIITVTEGENTISYIMTFMYDESGNAFGFNLDGVNYYYIKNAQNDVMAISDNDGNIVVSYQYDSWGKINNCIDVTETNISALNPYTYRSYYYDTETQGYYLKTRYYYPELHRFICADAVTDGGAGVIGCNIFIYSANNPINNTDSTGAWIIKDSIKWAAKNIVKPIVKTIKNISSKANLTCSSGINISGAFKKYSFNIQIGVSVDSKGNFALQRSHAGGITTSKAGMSITKYRAYTNAPNISKLEDEGYQVGGSFSKPVEGVPITIGGDINYIPNKESRNGYYGFTINGGLGSPGAEVHLEQGNTKTINNTQYNIFDIGKDIYVKLMEW